MRSEYLNPAVSIADSGDFAALAYNLNTYALDDNGNERQPRPWNATEAHRLIDGDWPSWHSNWAFTQTAKGSIASGRGKGPPPRFRHASVLASRTAKAAGVRPV